jgi:transcriptional regulator with XRE-family HTH domain
MMMMPQRIRDARKAKGLTQEALAEILGVERPAISQWETGKTNVDPKNMKNLADALSVTVAYLSGEEDEPSNVSSPVSQSGQRFARNGRQQYPVWGTVECGEDGAFQITEGNAVAWNSTPPALENILGLYGVFAEGASMIPRFFPGELVLVHPRRTVTPHRDVIIQLKPKHDGDAPKALLKRLVRKNSEEIEVEQYNPPKRRVIKMKDILSLHLVLDRSEM